MERHAAAAVAGPQLRAEFQTMGLAFASEGCWKITATAGDRTLDVVTRVRTEN